MIESEDKGRGYQIGKDDYMPVEDEELDSLALESTHTIDIEKFVPRSEIDERHLDSLYYLTTEDKVEQTDRDAGAARQRPGHDPCPGWRRGPGPGWRGGPGPSWHGHRY